MRYIYPLEEARKLAKERTEQYYKINKIRCDKKKIQEADFKAGDLVMYVEFQYPNTRKNLGNIIGCYLLVSHDLSDDQKQAPLEASQDLVEKVNLSPNFLNCTVTKDDYRCLRNDPEMERQNVEVFLLHGVVRKRPERNNHA
ncbi:hypothetical protein TNCV_4628741 [Trichonephila clavipes]|nr:hypothetical protein TNCV_4628741 [Trichonephila clavipes]